MMFAQDGDAPIKPSLSKALDLIFLLHADHEQTAQPQHAEYCSGGANPFASLAGAVQHFGVRCMEVPIWQLLICSTISTNRVTMVANLFNAKEGNPFNGLGHRVYRNYDPRAKILKSACDKALEALGISSPILDIARRLEEVALQDPYFIDRKLYPNVDFYSGIILQALVFRRTLLPCCLHRSGTVMVSPLKEIAQTEENHRPRQIYQGLTLEHINHCLSAKKTSAL